MKILHTSDLHLSKGRRRALLAFEEPFDVWLDTGDFLPTCKKVYDTLDPTAEKAAQRRWADFCRLGARLGAWLAGRPVVTVAGNHCFWTLGEVLRMARVPNVFEVTPEGVEVAGLRFAGFRQIPRYLNDDRPPWDWAGEIDRDDFAPLVAHVRAAQPDIVATHAPLSGVHSVDECRDDHGFPGAPWAAPVRAHFHGHVHATGGCHAVHDGVHHINGATFATVTEVTANAIYWGGTAMCL